MECPPRDPLWTTAELEHQAYEVALTPDETSALRLAVDASPAWHAITRRHVPASCAQLWPRVERCLDDSAGFCVVRGLPFDGSADDARKVAFLTGYGLGTPVFQDAQAGRMVDIRSTDADAMDAATYKPRSDGTHVRPYETRAAFRLHADPCDVAMLFCVRDAASGGSSSVVNARALHQRLQQTQPELVEVLSQPFFYAKPRKADEPASFHGIPVFSWHEGHFKAHIVPDLIFIAQLVPEVPRLSDAQHAALDALMTLASSPEFKVELRLRPGELLLLNNHVVWHGRDAYQDAGTAVRHLLRAWLATPHSRPLAPVHRAWFGNPSPGALRGGYLRERLHELADESSTRA